MPWKCCTVYDGEACHSNYDETKNIPHEKVTTYSFPEDPTERELWIRSLPNILSCKITKNVSVCEKHFPPDCQRIKKPGGYLVPAVPPSIFGDTKCSLFVQTATPSRVPKERNIIADIHSEDANINNDCCTLDLKESEADLELMRNLLKVLQL